MKTVFLLFSLSLATSSSFAASESFRCNVGVVDASRAYDSRIIDVVLDKKVADFPDSITGGSTKVALKSHAVAVHVYHREDPATAEMNFYSFQARVFEPSKTAMSLELKSKVLESAIQQGLPLAEVMTPNLSVSLSCEKVKTP